MKLEYCNLCNIQTSTYCGRDTQKVKGPGMSFGCSIYTIDNNNYFLLPDTSEKLYKQGFQRLYIKELIIKDINNGYKRSES
jgi:hypothetical protein